MGILVNIDNGGTFTDVCISDGEKVVHAKTPTTPHDLTQCFLEVLKRGSDELYGEPDAARLIREAECLRYSTTSGTNAVVEHKGTPVALLVDSGEEDNVYGAATRLGDHDLWRAMVPQNPVGISVSKSFDIDADELIAIVNQLLTKGALRLVVALRSEVAEQNIKQLLLDRYPRHLLGAIPFLVSSELAYDGDLARRTITAVVNSYLHPGMEHFLYGAENICKEQHLKKPLLIFRNDGDSARVAKTTAIKTWGSGPRGGLDGAVAYAQHYGLDSVVTMDIGGTTSDISVVTGQGVTMLAYGAIEGTPTSFPLPTIHSFGVGGSSVVRVDQGSIKIGPDSVGASPGPACYGRGGTEATLTDALVVAGVLDPDRYLGGEISLDRERAEQAVLNNVGEARGEDATEAAAAIIKAFQGKIAEELTTTLEHSGCSAAATTLLAYGGGGPMIASGVANSAGMKRVIVPRLASVFSAFGIGFSHLAHEHKIPLDSAVVGIEALGEELEARARRDMYGEGVDPASCSYTKSLWGAVGDIAVNRPLTTKKLKLDGELSDPRLTVRAVFELPTLTLRANTEKKYSAAKARGKVAINLDGKKALELPVVDDGDLKPGKEMIGPGLIQGDYLTSIVEAGWRLRVSSNGDLVFEAK